MDPANPFQPTPKSPLPGDDSTRQATANVARSQIDQIFGIDGQPNETLSHTNQASQPMINQNPVSVSQRSASSIQVPGRQATSPSSIPYPQTSRQETANIQAQPATAVSTEQPTEQQTTVAQQPAVQLQQTTSPYDQTHAPTSNTDVEAKHKQYHEAWQQYYKESYEKYYVNAMQEQKKKFASGQAAVPIPQTDGTITQSEAIDELRNDIVGKIKKSARKVRKSRHFIPAIAAVLVILLAVFIQYNGLIFAQVSTFVSPGTTTNQDIIIGTGSNTTVSNDPTVVIPKINVSAPVIYGLTDLSEEGSQKALQNGVIHYPIGGANAHPGQNGNTVVLGHSSADFFEPGNYKFIFVQLNRLGEGDLFYLDYEGTRYTYKVFKTEIIAPSEVGKLAIGNDKPYATLITCDPVGTAVNRFIVYGEQISPDPASAKAASSNNDSTSTNQIVGNPPTLFEQIFGG